MKTENIIKIKILTTIIAALSLILLLFPIRNITASAMSQQPPPKFAGSGLVFKEYEHIKINKEVLNLRINDDSTVSIKDVYTLENTSQETLNVDTMFLFPAPYYEDKEFVILKNNTELEFLQKFVKYTPGVNAFDNWENVLEDLLSPARPFGDGTGFCKYTISCANEQNIVATFLPLSHYFLDGTIGNSSFGGKVTLTKYAGYYGESFTDMVFVSADNLDLETNGNVVKTKIEDIYEYLFQKATLSVYEEYLAYAEEQFCIYLSEIRPDNLACNYFFLEYAESYPCAITSVLDFAPGEKIEVSYEYQTESLGGSYLDFTYLLPSAKYRNSNSGIEINLVLGEKFKRIISSSVNFSKIGRNQYQFVSSSLPGYDLKLKVNDGSRTFGETIIIIIIVILAAIVLIPTAIITFIIVVIVKTVKRRM